MPLEAVINSLTRSPYTFDGVTGLISKKGKSRQIVFEGKIWVITNPIECNEKLEPFKAIITDKRITKQGIHIKIWYGENVFEGNILEIL